MNRYLNQFRKAFIKEQVSVFAKVTIGASGAPTLVAAYSQGVKSIVRNSAGNYTVTFGLSSNSAFTQAVDKYVKFFNAQCCIISSAAPAAPLFNVASEAVAASGTVVLQFRDAADAAADPANGEILLLQFELNNSTAL